MKRHAAVACAAMVLILLAAGAAEAAKKKPPAPANTGAAPVDAGTAPAAPRAGWLTDRVPLRVGDLVTVVVDEQTAAHASVSRTAIGDRSLSGNLTANVQSTTSPQNTAVQVNSGLDLDSRDEGETSRQGGLMAVLSVRVTALEAGGLVRVAGSRKVDVDGQAQEIALEGVIRPEDVSPGNIVASNCISDAVITYKGKKIGPRTGIMGRFLGMLWP
jgi:flagellar L-ring protein FlgH